jgi:hypothetical protein
LGLPDRKLLQLASFQADFPTCHLGNSPLVSISESEEHQMDSMEAAAALAGVSGAQERFADQIAHRSPIRHAAFGFVMALLVGALALPLVLQTAITAMAMALVVIIVQYDRRRYGTFINGYRRGRTLAITFPLLGMILLLMLAQMYARIEGLPGPVKLGIVAAAFVLATGGSIVWKRVYLGELRAGRR